MTCCSSYFVVRRTARDDNVGSKTSHGNRFREFSIQFVQGRLRRYEDWSKLSKTGLQKKNMHKKVIGKN